jgi:CspA family cold shock protein
MKIKIIVTLLFTLTLKFNVIAAERVENEKTTTESVFAVVVQMETFDSDVLKAEIKGLSLSESDKLVKMVIKDAKAIELSDRKSGTVKWYNKEKGFGFITPVNGGSDVYFRVSSIHSKNKDLKEGQRVTYVEVSGQKGPQADDVQLSE